MGNGPGSIGRARSDARYERNVAFNEMNNAQQRYNNTVRDETKKDNKNIADNRQDVRNIEQRKAEEQLKRTMAETKDIMIDTRNKLNSGFSSYLSEKNKFLSGQIDPLKNTFKVIFSKTTTELNDLILDISNQNTALELQIKENKANENHSKLVKSNFLNVEIDKLMYQNKILWYVFYVLLLILGFVMYFYSNLSMVFQIIVFHILLVYPFLIYYTELLVYILYSYSYSFFTSTKFQQLYLGEY
jgi:hypothetical protein